MYPGGFSLGWGGGGLAALAFWALPVRGWDVSGCPWGRRRLRAVALPPCAGTVDRDATNVEETVLKAAIQAGRFVRFHPGGAVGRSRNGFGTPNIVVFSVQLVSSCR